MLTLETFLYFSWLSEEYKTEAFIEVSVDDENPPLNQASNISSTVNP